MPELRKRTPWHHHLLLWCPTSRAAYAAAATPTPTTTAGDGRDHGTATATATATPRAATAASGFLVLQRSSPVDSTMNILY